MKPDAFLITVERTDGPDHWPFDMLGPVVKGNAQLFDALRRAPLEGVDDAEACIALAQLLHRELEAHGTGGSSRLDDDDMALAVRALRAALGRIGVQFDLPFRGPATFYDYWVREGAKGSYQARRDILSGLFDPLYRELERIEDENLQELARAVSPREATGWQGVDTEIRELRRRFRSSSTPQDYRAVGSHCVGVLDALSRTVYNPERHLREGETVPPVDHSKQRIGRFVEDALAGAENEDLRRLVKAAIEFAQHVKHSPTPTRSEAGVASDAVILLANLLRRVEEED